MPSFIALIEAPETHYHAQLHQNLTNSFQIIDNFLIEKNTKKLLRSKSQSNIT